MRASRRPTTWTKPKGVAQGQMKALDAASIASIRGHLANHGSQRDRALFALALDSMLRGHDLVRLRVRDVVDHLGAVRESFPVVQGKISAGKAHTVLCYLTAPTRDAVAALIAAENKSPDAYLFTGRGRSHPLSTCQVRLLLKGWCEAVGLDPTVHSNHSLRRTKAAALYKQSHDLELVRQALGHAYLSSTQSYLSVGSDEVRAACLNLSL